MQKRFLIFLGLAIFSGWLMFRTLSYDVSHHQILVSGKFWSDFGGYLPQIRSFSLGKNWPPQYPLFPGEPTKYHFLFYMLTGLLEKTGVRIDLALNILSASGFFLLLVMIWLLGLEIFEDERVSWLSLLFFLFNGSFSFLDFIRKYPLSSHSFTDVIHLKDFVSFAPWNDSHIAAFWNLNVFSNQRHFGLSIALGLLVIYFIYSHHRRGMYLVGFLAGLLIVLNQAVFACVLLFIFSFFLFDRTSRLPLLFSALGGIPWVVIAYLTSSHTPASLEVHYGFLLKDPLTAFSFFWYWLQNFGLHLFLIPIGFFLSPKKSRILIPPLVVIFILPNVLRLSVDIINNHKFFNFFLVLGVLFSAYALVTLWDKIVAARFIIPIVIIFLILGGVIDLFPVINDYYYSIPDIQSNPDATYFVKNTPPDSIVLNSTWFYHPASIAGRFIYNGYSYFTWSFGYDQISREQSTISIYTAKSKPAACKLLKSANISYVELNPHPENFITPNWNLWYNQFVPSYTNASSGLKVYSVFDNCKSL